jgi:collagenase-like PrtC family protease
MKISLGSILYYWSKETVLDFYEQIANSAVEIVYVGETVCAKRKMLKTSEWIELARYLSDKGKQVVLSTLALIEAESDLKTLQRLCENGEFLVEANDLAAVQFLQGKPFFAGHAINIYNSRTLLKLSKVGLKRWVLPVELSKETLFHIQNDKSEQIEIEVFVFGRLPLAYSARCFTARAHNLPKDNCQFRCLDYPDGLLLSSQESEKLLNINGIQTQSAKIYNLLSALPELKQLNVDVIRISPQSRHTLQIIDIFDRYLKGITTLEESENNLKRFLPTDQSCNGYWYSKAGMLNK